MKMFIIIWEKVVDFCFKKENMYDQCNLGGEDIYKYGVISGLYVSFVMVNINYDCVILVSVNVNMFRQSYFVCNGDN